MVLDFVPQRRISCTHWSPLGGSVDRPENYHTVSYDLADEGGGRTRLILTQDNNPTQAAADEMAKSSWGPVLVQLKATAEKVAEHDKAGSADERP